MSRQADSGPLAGQVALVTGAGRGIGRHLAVGLAAHGAAVAAFARTTAEVDAVAAEITDSGGQAIAVTGDVTVRSDVEGAMAELEERLGGLTLLVNNAGTCRAVGPVAGVDPDEWWREVEIHVRGAALTTHGALARMAPRGRGRIVNVYGNLGDDGSTAYCSAYAAAKAALLRLTEHTALEAAGAGITVLALHPGLVRTPLIDELATGDAGRRWLPRFGQRSPDEFMDPARLVAAVVAVASGVADALSGRWLGAWEDIAAVAADAESIRAEDRRALRLGQA